MRNVLIALAVVAAPLAAEDKPAALAPSEIVTAAPKGDWVAIAASDLLVVDLEPDAKGRPRRVVIQLMPPPFSQGWIGNIRKLAAAKWWDGLSVNRVQDNYVLQWGDAEAESKAKAKALPLGLADVPDEYIVRIHELSDLDESEVSLTQATIKLAAMRMEELEFEAKRLGIRVESGQIGSPYSDHYAKFNGFESGWPVASDLETIWPVHCYGMVGVGRDMPPDTGSGAELYVVIGHAPRHLDRNIALVGRVIEGIEHLSSLPRGTGALGFYESAEERTAIQSIHVQSEMPSDKPLPSYEYLSTESASFAAYADARANRRDPFFIRPAGGADICNIPVPVRRVNPLNQSI